jgi:hypothetical protein
VAGVAGYFVIGELREFYEFFYGCWHFLVPSFPAQGLL